jgi:cholesterol transport system auxiliary component
MKTARRNAIAPVFGLVIVLIAGGCSIKQSYPAKDYFALEVNRETEATPPSDGKTLLVRDFIVSPKFEDKGFVYRLTDQNYETDYYNEFLVPPGALLGEDTREWLADSGIFDLVGDRRTVVSPTFSLHVRVIALYGDMRVKGQEKAVLEARIFVFEHAEPEVSRDSDLRFQEIYREKVPLNDRSPAALVEGWNTAFRNILTAVENDLRGL